MKTHWRILTGLGVVIPTVYFLLAGVGGRLMVLFLFLWVLFLFSYYLGFIEKSSRPLAYLSQAGAATTFLLIIFVTTVSSLDQRGRDEISKFITVYPNIKTISYLPRVADDQIQYWLVETEDTDEQVNRFYSKPEHREGWQVMSEPPMIILKRDSQKLHILIQRNESGTTIYYDLTRLPPPRGGGR